MCDVHICNEEGLTAAYHGEVPFTRDGLLFAHQDSPYVLEGNPFVLQWKDTHCSRWAVHTDKDGAAMAEQQLVRSATPPCMNAARMWLAAQHGGPSYHVA